MKIDQEYWEEFYRKQNIPFSPSPFAIYVLEQYMKNGENTVELGCGNGRDAIYFAQNGIKVMAIDQCKEELEFLSEKYSLPNLEFKVDDFTVLSTEYKFDNVYSRFTLHSISKSNQMDLIKRIKQVLKPGGLFFVEARGQNNELYGKGKPVDNEKDAFIFDNHFRRFIDFSELVAFLKKNDFCIIEADEKKGFSPLNGKDETFMRIIAKNNN